MDKSRILIVDDNEDARSGLVHYLDGENYVVAEAGSGEEAIKLIKENNYNIILTDLIMQDIDGIGVLNEAKKIQPQTEVIIMTAFASVDTAVGAIKQGAYDYISKPINMEELLLLLDKCREKQKLASEVSGLKEVLNLYEVSKGINTFMHLSQLLDLIIKLAGETLEAEGGSIMLIDKNTGKLTARAATGKRRDIVIGKTLEIGERIAGYSAEKADSIRITGNLKDDPRFNHLEQYDGISSSITVPLLRKNNLLGVISLNRSLPQKGYTENDVKLLSIFASQAAVAIENSNLFNTLQQEKEKLDTLFSEMRDGAVILNEQLEIVFINQAAKKFLNLDDTAIGKKIVDVTGYFSPSMPWDILKKIKEEIIDLDLVRKKGQLLYLSVSASTIKDKNIDTDNYILILRNITEEKKEELVQRNFLRLMSHKLKTPLTNVIGFTANLSEKETLKKLNKQEQESISIISTESFRLSTLIDKLLRYTLLETEELEISRSKINIHDIIKKVMDALEETLILYNINTFISKEMDNLPEVNVDPEKIQEVIEKLVENAIKFNDNEEKNITISGIPSDNGFVEIHITDNGPGIPVEETEKIFEKFQQLEKYFTGRVDGMGLGLPLARKIIEAHKGRIWVESPIGKGSTFIFTLPVD
ncbi:response regulator [Elusimicrobiota bacterium]